jgi:thioredoxin reductase (NADPH)
MIERARENPRIRWELNQVVEEILGDQNRKPQPAVTGLRLKHVGTGQVKDIELAAVFVAIGHIPTTSIMRGQVDMDERGYIKVNGRQETNVPGVYAAGDCHDRRWRQAVTAAGMGCAAALEVERFLTERGLT